MPCDMKKLIFIDDSPLDHFILKRMLNQYPLAYEVNCTANGAEVIDFLEKHCSDPGNLPDIILLDLYMPGFDGWTFLDKVEQLRTHLAKPVKIYILSASINPEDIQETKQYASVSSFIFKPVTKDALEKLINDKVSNVA
jgi:CheY-like chemotaxis protein